MTGTDRELLLAVMDGDLAAGLGLIDRLIDARDTRVDAVRKAIGKVVVRVLDIWQDADAPSPGLDYDLRLANAAECLAVLERMRITLTELFWIELLTPKEIVTAGLYLAESIMLVDEEFEESEA